MRNPEMARGGGGDRNDVHMHIHDQQLTVGFENNSPSLSDLNSRTKFEQSSTSSNANIQLYLDPMGYSIVCTHCPSVSGW